MSLTTPGTSVPTGMFSVLASTMPAPATYAVNGACAGSATGCDAGTGLFPARTNNTAKIAPNTAIAGRKYLVIMTSPRSELGTMNAEASRHPERRRYSAGVEGSGHEGAEPLALAEFH